MPPFLELRLQVALLILEELLLAVVKDEFDATARVLLLNFRRLVR